MNKFCDLHLHLGGSISKDLVRRFAELDHDQDAIEVLAQGDVLKLFQVVHHLVQSPERIRIATEDVIRTTTADYLEIRSTPRPFSAGQSFHPYVEAFVSVLRRFPEKVRGILSIDRYQHDLRTAKEIISLAREFPD